MFFLRFFTKNGIEGLPMRREDRCERILIYFLLSDFWHTVIQNPHLTRCDC